MMPYKDKERNRVWHKETMRKRRLVTPILHTKPKIGYEQLVKTERDADGNPIPEY